MAEDELIPELGDVVTIVSRVHKTTTGQIVYRDGSLIRIQDRNNVTRPVTFELDPTTGHFLERYGVTEVVIYKKRADPHFAIQLGTVVGEMLEFYDVNGDPIAPGKAFIVEEIIATEDTDAIRLAGGVILDFGFLGTPDGIGVIIPYTPPEEDEIVANEAAPTEVAEDVEPFPGFDAIALPAALVEEVPTEERMYSDTIQRADMFASLYMDVSPKRQKDPRILAGLYRTTDVLLALKNSVVMRDEGGAVVIGQTRSYVANTLQDAIAKQSTGEPLAAAMPVAAIKKVVYVDEDTGGERRNTEVRLDEASLLAAAAVQSGAAAPSGVGGNAFLQMMHSLLQTQEAYVPAEASEKRIVVDQDVLRSAMPGEPVEGFPFMAVPAPAKNKEDTIPLKASFLGSIEDRVVRLIGPSRIKNNRTGAVYTVAPADTGATIGHVVLPRDLITRRAPTRSSVLLWDVLASEVGRRMTTTFYNALKEQIGETEFVYGERASADELADLPLAAQLEARLTGYEGATQFINRESVMTMDAFGLRNLELTAELLAPLKKAIEAGQAAWGAAYGRLKAAALTASKRASTPAVRGIVDETSPLMSAETLGDATLLPLVQVLRERESTLKTYDLVYANDLVKQASNTLGLYWYALASDAAEEAVAAARDVFVHEAARLDNITSVRRDKATEFVAKPVLNDCEHVHRLEKIYAIRDDAKRMVMLDKFIKEYQAGQRGNYILCGSCGDNLVCRHEVLMINEFMNPGRATALHKALLLEFGNGVFEGAYICKNCGQKLREIEYDMHLEFDENGKPLVGRGVIEPADPEDTDFAINLADDEEKNTPFTDKAEVAVYKNARTIFEAMGYNAPPEVYKRLVPAAIEFVKGRVMPEAQYNKDRERAMATKGAQVPIEYKAYFANYQIGVLAALAVLELQTMVGEIPVPHAGVEYSRNGFPLEGGLAAGNEGAIYYVTFCVANLTIDSVPWNETSWAADSNPRMRLSKTRNALLSTLFTLLALPAPSAPGRPPNKAPAPLGEVTAAYTDRLAAERARRAAAGEMGAGVAKASEADQLPPSFRPLTFLEAPKEGFGGQVAIGNLERFQENIRGGDVSKVAPAVAARSHILTQRVMGDFHAQAKAGAILSKGSPYSFSSCCHKRIAAVGVTGFGVGGLGLPEAAAREIAVVGAAAREVKLADPAASAAGTHLYMPWKAPVLTTVLPTPQPDDYYKLFLKNCFQGRAYGLPHEFNAADSTCRNCGFELPVTLRSPLGADLPLNMGDKAREKRLGELAAEAAEAARGAIAAAGVVISEESFLKLEAAIRARRQVPEIVRPVQAPFLARLAAMFALPSSLDMLLPVARDHAVALLTGLQAIADQPDVMNARTDAGSVARLTALGPFTAKYDAMLAAVQATMTGLVTRELKPDVQVALDALAALTANPVGGVSARNVLSAFVLTAEQIANNYPNDQPLARKWFPKIARSHMTTLEKIWGRAAEVATGGIAALKGERSEEVAEGVRSILHKFTGWLSPWLTVWISEFRPDDVAVSGEELTLMLRWLVVSGMSALLTPDSPLYGDIGGADAKKAIVRFMNIWLIDLLVKNGKAVAAYQLTRKQIEEQLQVRAEKEEAYFIEKFDKLDQDLRKVELIKKRLKIGDWSVGTTKNLFRYDADFFEFERDQRAAMGVPDFEESVTGVAGGAAAEVGGDRYGLGRVGGGEVVNVHENDHYAETGEEY